MQGDLMGARPDRTLARRLDRAWKHGHLLRGIAGARDELEHRYRDDPEALRYALAGAGLNPNEQEHDQ